MSYAAYVQAGRDASSLLDEDTLLEETQNVFMMFFQHYVNSSVSLETGGWAYQPIGANLEGLGPAIPGTISSRADGGCLAVDVSDLPPQNTQCTTEATVSSRVEVLRINNVAFWISLSLLIWLTITTIIIAALQRWYFRDIHRNVECIADVLVLVAGSERLLALVREKGIDRLMQADIKTRLGWFRPESGKMRYGIEVVADGEVLMK